MDAERWQRARAICRSALTVEVGSRSGYVSRECEDDSEMRREVESLITIATAETARMAEPADGARFPEPYFGGNERFAVQRRLGSGGFGVVYQVYDRERGAVVALKVLQRSEAGPLLQFKQEFRVLGDMWHPNLVGLYELLYEEGRWFFTMELVEGVNFLSYVRSLGDDFDGLRRAMRQLANGISAVHAYGKLHCDLKPGNVLVDASGRLVILDFGLVTDAAATAGRGVGFGTPGYMSPEQQAGLAGFSGKRLVQRRSDAVSGAHRKPAVRGSSAWAKYLATVEPSSIAALRPNAPSDLCELAAALLQPNPLLRPMASQVLRRWGCRRMNRTEPRGSNRRLSSGAKANLRRCMPLSARATAERPTTIFIHGPSGVGKSAVTRHFLNEVRAFHTHIVVESRCHERESVPYKALDSLVDSLHRYLTSLPVTERAQFIPSDFFALMRLFPVLENVAGTPGRVEIASPAELRLRGFQALRELLERLATRRPVVLLIDDLQWGDMDSAPFLLDLVSDPAPCPDFVSGLLPRGRSGVQSAAPAIVARERTGKFRTPDRATRRRFGARRRPGPGANAC